MSKLRRAPQNAVRYDKELGVLVVRLPNGEQDFLLDPATVRRNDQSASSINEWTGERTLRCVGAACLRCLCAWLCVVAGARSWQQARLAATCSVPCAVHFEGVDSSRVCSHPFVLVSLH